MKILCIYFLLIISLVSAQNSYALKDGSTIKGTVVLETETEITIETNFGVMTISKSDILTKIYKVELNYGDSIFGEKIFEDEYIIRLKTNYGEVELKKSEVKSITEKGKKIQDEKTYTQRPLGLSGLLFGGYTMDKDSDFSLGEEQLIDLFFDPTGYILDQGTLYLSGFSFGFGISDKLQISSKWSGFFYNNFNIRPKLQIVDIGNWEKQHSLSVGLHYHSNWWSDKYVWKSGAIDLCDSDIPDQCETKWWSGYYEMGQVPEYEYNSNGYENKHISRTDDFNNEQDGGGGNMIEFFGAYTHSTAREGLKGRTSHTFGANIQIVTATNTDYFYRIYYGIDVDINRKLKMIGEVFYDPYYEGGEGGFFGSSDNYHFELNELSNSQILKPIGSFDNFHGDFGFMYALNESFRFGLHFQPYIFAFYWKF